MNPIIQTYDVSFLDDRDFCSWFLGFTDGEGCFGLVDLGNDIYCEFSFTGRMDDIEVYRYIYQNIRVGHINPKARHGYINDLGQRSKPFAAYQIRNVTELIKVIVPMFDKYSLKSKKMKEYPFWKYAVELKYQRKISKIKLSKESFLKDMRDINGILKDYKAGKDFNWEDPNLLRYIRK
jgi:hypothetical protein